MSGSTRGQTAALARFALSGLIILGLLAAPSLIGAAAARPIQSPPPPRPESNIELSVDGQHWASRLYDSPFPSGLIWVPGDTASGTVWVRTTCDYATGVVTWKLVPDNPPVWAEHLGARTRLDEGPWGDTIGFADCFAVTEFAITADDPVRLDLEVAFPWGNATTISTNDTQHREAKVESAVVTLTCDGEVNNRPALHRCEPRTGHHGPGDRPGGGDEVADAGGGSDVNDAGGAGPAGSGSNHDAATGEAGNPEAGVAPNSVNAEAGGVFGVAASLMSLTGVEIIRTALTASLLVLAGTWLVIAARRRREARHG